MEVKFLILGAGPAGLTFANQLQESREKSFLVLEKEKWGGGLCRSVYNNGPFDIGGGHFLDVKNKKVLDYLFHFMPHAEWNTFERNSQIFIHNQYINSPIESNIWQMELKEQIEYLKDIAAAGCNNGIKKPDKFVDWIEWKLGQKIAADYMIPYNKKMFADELNNLGTYWLNKLPDVSFEEILYSCLEHKSHGRQPAHSTFLYPKEYGYGEVWERMSKNVENNVMYGQHIYGIAFDKMEIKTHSGLNVKAQFIINTIPWKEFKEIQGMPSALHEKLGTLRHSAIETRLYLEDMDTLAHWIYYSQEDLPYHRKLIRHNFCPYHGYWTETRYERISMFDAHDSNVEKYINEYAYPLNTINKSQFMQDLLSWCRTKQVYGLGRWGEHEHYNSDIVVQKALQLYEKISGGNYIE